MAVLRLLKIKLPKVGVVLSRKERMDADADEMRLDDDAWHRKWDRLIEEPFLTSKTVSQGDYTELERAALDIAGRFGTLSFEDYEPLSLWAELADQIQTVFHARDIRKGLPKDLASTVGRLEMDLVFTPDGVSMRLSPVDTGSALIYHAAQMVTNGTKVLNCEYCSSPFLSGGEARGGGKRRRDARFCSDECRWKHHNEIRSKAARKKKL